MDLVNTEQLCITERKVDLVEPEAEVTSELSRLENHIPLNLFQLEDRLRECTLAFIPLQILFSERLTQAVVFRETARDRDKLKEMGITHILNAAVLIHCTQGLSHSATLFLAYLMICHDMMVEEAFDRVIKVRRIRPCFGHLRKLVFLNTDLVLHTGKM
uniref:Tyrosine specific protein phosphatases domain-containing protein n=1 Tax=Cyprinus carpio TaxID=7962 RepID=A0A8C1RBU2_CYPCA